MGAMNEPASCDPACRETCTAPCAAPLSPISLSEAQERYQREAVRGVCDTGRYRCRYYVWGAGPPLVFLQGLADTSGAFLLPIAHLSRWFRCIAYDLPNGRDGARLSRYTHPDLVEDLWRVLDHVGANQSYIYAASFGSTVALAALKARPQRLPRAILQAPVAYKPLTRIERICAWLLCRLPGTMASLPLRRRFLTCLHHAPFAHRPPEVWEHFLALSGTVPIHTVGRRARMLDRIDLFNDLSEVRQPVLLVIGDGDPIVSLPDTEELLERLPSAGRAVLEECGHVPNFTHPEALAQLIRLFLTPPAPCPEHDARMHLADC